MSYHNILVAVDFEKGTLEVIEKAIKLARPLNAKVSLIHIQKQAGEDFGFGGLVGTEFAYLEHDHSISNALSIDLDALAGSIDYPIEHKFLIKGDLSHGMEEPVKEANIDLIVCGHHHNFWSRLKPSARGLINSSKVDLLIVSLPS